jgi:hypothetical protein
MKRWVLSFFVFPIALFISLFAFHILTSREVNIEVFRVHLTTLEKGLAEKDLVGGNLTDADHTPELEVFSESFTDDSHIGRRKKNKVDLRCHDEGNRTIAEIRFYSRFRNEPWKQTQSFEFKKDNLSNCDPQVSDFNNDGLKDFTYKSSVAARGANEIRTLFIYDEKKDEFVHIKNSDQYPNLAYNKNLDCLDAWLFHGATTTVFLKLEGDKLRKFASVDTGLEQVVTAIDKDGKSRVLSRKKMSEDDIYTRYSSYNPPTP